MDYGSWDVLSDRHVKLASEAGALFAMPIALNIRALPQLLAGEFAAAASLITQLEAVTEAAGSSLAPYAALLLAALRGRETEADRLIEAGMKEAERGGQAGGSPSLNGPPRCCTTASAGMSKRSPG